MKDVERSANCNLQWVEMAHLKGECGYRWQWDIPSNHKNYIHLDCDWFRKLSFSTNSLANLLLDSLLSDNKLNKPITFQVVV